MPFRLAVILLCLAGDPAQELAGRWTTGRISMIQYKDAYTGVYKPPSGSHFAYEFNHDGTYTFAGLMQSTMYSCTTATFSLELGTYEFSNGAVTLHPKSNPYKMTNSCAPSSNREAAGKLIDRTYNVRIDGAKLELSSDRSSVQTFTRDAN
jgi:hypothetical protein